MLIYFDFLPTYLVLQVRTHKKRESVMQCMHNKTDYPFDYFFEHTTSNSSETNGPSDQTDMTSEHLTPLV